MRTPAPAPDAPPGVPIVQGDHAAAVTGTFHKSSTTGDTPLTTSYSITGRVGVAVDVIPFPVEAFPASFAVGGIPAGSTILRSTMYVQRWDPPTTDASAILDGTALGPVAPFVEDPAVVVVEPDTEPVALLLQSYRFDVTGVVSGNGNYPFTFSTDGGQNYFAALVVVYSNPSLPARTVFINDGGEALGLFGDPVTSTTVFGFAGAGSGTLTVITQADNSEEGGESLAFNGTTILGPGDVFDANLGVYASLYQLPVTTVYGRNTGTVTATEDLFGWQLAILEAPPAALRIDIKPGSASNPIHTESPSLVPVAVLGGDAFDVTGIDAGSLTFGPAGAAPAHNLARLVLQGGHLQDVNGDGFTDLVAHFRQVETGITPGDTEACLAGVTTDGISLDGCDNIRTVQ